MTGAKVWPHLTSARARQLMLSIALLSPEQGRRASRTTHASARAATGWPAATPDDVRQLQIAMRAVADEHGWPRPCDPPTGEAVDRAWSLVLVERMDASPVDAAREGVWAFLSLVALPDLARWRFPRPPSGRYIGVDQHVFGRLWWRGYVLGRDLVDPADVEPLSEDELVALFRRRDLVANPGVARAVARAVLATPSRSSPRPRLMKYAVLELLRRMPAVSFDLLDPGDLDTEVERVVAEAALATAELPNG